MRRTGTTVSGCLKGLRMNPSKVVRAQVRELTDLPNVGIAMAADLRLLGIHQPQQLAGCDPYALYAELCQRTQTRQDPCVLDVFLSVVRFVNGEAQQPWWHYSAERKAVLARQNGLSGSLKATP